MELKTIVMLDEKEGRAKKSCSDLKGQGHNQRSKVIKYGSHSSPLLLTICGNSMNLHTNIEIDEKVCR